MSTKTPCATTILVVEDDELLNKSIRTLLNKAGMTCEGFFTGETALERVFESPDNVLLLLDYSLSDLTAKEVVEKVRGRGLEIPFVIITGHGDEALAVELMKLGAVDYITKTIQFHELLPAKIKHACREIEDRKKLAEAEAAVQQAARQVIASESRYRRLFESAQEGILILDYATGLVIGVNPFLCDLLGNPRQHFLGKHFWQLGVFKDIAASKESFVELQKKKYVRYEDLPLKTSDGRGIEVEFVSNVYLVDGKEVIQCNMRDITMRKKAEESLKRSEAQLRAVLDTAPFPVAMVDSNYDKILFWSSSALALFGHTAPTSAEWYKIAYPDPQYRQEVVNRWKPFVEEARSTGEAVNAGEYRVMCSNGSVRVCELFASFVADNLVVTFNDITERKQVESALRESEEKFRNLFNNAEVGMFRTRLDGSMFLDLNEKYVSILGGTREELLGSSSADFWGDPDAREEMVRTLKAKGHVENLEFRLVRKDGKIIDCVTSVRLNPEQGVLEGSLIDITDRKRAHEELRESDEKYRSLVDGANEAILVVQDGMLRFVNRKAVEIAGYSEADLTGRPFSEFVFPDDLQMVAENYVKRIKGDPAPSRYEFRLLAADKGARWVEINAVLIDWNGKPATLNFLTNITERKRVEEDLKTSKEQLSQALDIARLGPWEYDVPKDLFTFNDNFYRMFRTSAAQVGGYSMSSAEYARRFVHPDDRLMVGEEVRKAIEATDPNFSRQLEHRILYADGTEGYISVRFFIIKNAQGQTVRTHGVNQDSTDRKQAETALRESEERYRTLFDDAKDGIALADSETGKIVECNQALCTMVGMDKTELVGQMQSIIHPPQNLVRGQSAAFVRHKTGDAGITVEDQIISKTGTLTPVEIRAARVSMNNRDYMLGIFRDISERKKHQTEKDVLQNQLLQAQKMEAIGVLAGGVAHDFNNLLTAISGYTTMAMGKIDESDPVQRDLKQVSIAATKAAGVTRQLLLFSRKQHMDPVPMDLNATISRMLKMLERIIGEDIVIETGLGPDIRRIVGDEGNIEQVLMNLSVNARDAMPGGGKLFIKTENVTMDDGNCRRNKTARPGRFVCLSISDTGTGMDELTQQHIFEPFFTTKPEGKGTGLGLSVVFGIVEQHQGWINVYSEPGHGTTFKVYFPSSSATPKQITVEEASIASLEGKGERIMVVEDQSQVRAIAKEILSTNGYSVFPVASAQEAKDLFERESGKFDLVFSDVVLPDTSGVLLVQDLLTRGKFGVIITSGYTDEKANWEFIKENNFRFLHKPYAVGDLLQAVKEVLGKRKVEKLNG